MVTRYIDWDEAYPVYMLDETPYPYREPIAIELSPEQLADYHEVSARYHDWQERLGSHKAKYK